MTGGTGSLRYLSPENFLGKPYNETADTYSFSIIVWELLARKPLLFMRSKRVGHARVECASRRRAERRSITDACDAHANAQTRRSFGRLMRPEKTCVQSSSQNGPRRCAHS